MYSDMAISLVEAIQNGDEKKAKLILRQRAYTNIDHQGARNDGTALFWACCKGYIELVHLLILHGAAVDRSTSWGASPLHASADTNRLNIADLLIRYGADVNKQTDSGDTPCHLASYRGYSACVQRLVEEGADIEIYNKRRHTPIEEAQIRGHYHTYRYLRAVQQIVRKCKGREASNTTENESMVEPLLQITPQGEPEATQLQTNACLPTTNTTAVQRRSLVRPDQGHAVGVLRIQNSPSSDSDYSLSSTSGSETYDYSSPNDLSSVTSDEYRTLHSTQMSFKNIQ